jgi:hypothetical protein
MNFVQGASLNFAGINMSLAYPNSNTAGNMGIVVCFAGNGNCPASIDDENDNTWCTLIGTNADTNLGTMKIFVCYRLKAGANVVNADFLCLAENGTPDLHILEYSYSPGAFILQLNDSVNSLGNVPLGGPGPGGQGIYPNPLPVYVNVISSGVQAGATVTVFLAVYGGNFTGNWESCGNGEPRIFVNENNSSTVSGEQSVVTTGTQTLFPTMFEVYDGVGTLNVAHYLAFVVVEP